MGETNIFPYFGIVLLTFLQGQLLLGDCRSPESECPGQATEFLAALFRTTPQRTLTDRQRHNPMEEGPPIEEMREEPWA